MKKIVFLPLSPKMWDGFETLWDKATSDPENEVKVIPVPTYKRGSDNQLSDAEYVTDGYPDNVEITDINEYSLRIHHPDIIYVQNIQDTDNRGFCVHPAFHTDKLKEYTDNLIYIPYLCTELISFDDPYFLASIRPLIYCPGICNVNSIIVQSENQKELYLYYLAGANTELRNHWSQKITCDNYPRNMLLKKYQKNNVPHPKEWDILLIDENGNYRKTIMLCTSVMSVLTGNRTVLRKLRTIFEEHISHRDEYVLIWHPYETIKDAINLLRPELIEDYEGLMDFYQKNSIGIMDNLSSPTAAIILSDEYMGDPCGVMELFRFTGKPVIGYL